VGAARAAVMVLLISSTNEGVTDPKGPRPIDASLAITSLVILAYM